MWPALHTLCWSNSSEEVRNLLSSDKSAVNQPLDDGLLPIHIASHSGAAECIPLLLEAGADVNAKLPQGSTPLYIASRNSHAKCVQELLKAPRLHRVPDSAVCTAASNGALDVIKVLLADERTNVNAKTDERVSALFLATIQGHLDVVKALIEAGADVNLRTEDGRTPLHASAYRGHADVTEALLNASADPSILNADMFSPLHVACYEGKLDVVKVYLRAGYDPTSPDITYRDRLLTRSSPDTAKNDNDMSQNGNDDGSKSGAISIPNSAVDSHSENCHSRRHSHNSLLSSSPYSRSLGTSPEKPPSNIIVSPYQLAVMKKHTNIVHAILTAPLWPQVRLIFIGNQKERSMQYARSRDDKCMFAWLPADVVRLIAQMLYKEAVKNPLEKCH